MRDVSNAFCTFSDNCLNDNDCDHCGYGKMLNKAYQQGRADAVKDNLLDIISFVYDKRIAEEKVTVEETISMLSQKLEQLKEVSNDRDTNSRRGRRVST